VVFKEEIPKNTGSKDLYRQIENACCMSEKTSTPSILRIAAAVFLGIIVGFILFLVAALFIGMFNNMMGMNIPVGMDIAENILSAVLLVIFVVGCIAAFCWKVWVTPSTEDSGDQGSNGE